MQRNEYLVNQDNRNGLAMIRKLLPYSRMTSLANNRKDVVVLYISATSGCFRFRNKLTHKPKRQYITPIAGKEGNIHNRRKGRRSTYLHILEF